MINRHTPKPVFSPEKDNGGSDPQGKHKTLLEEMRDQDYKWTEFYNRVAIRVLSYRNDRKSLIDGLHKISSKKGVTMKYLGPGADGNPKPLDDICPFSIMASFNRLAKDRLVFANELGLFLKTGIQPSDNFSGIPCLRNTSVWFFNPKPPQRGYDINISWELALATEAFVKSDIDKNRARFIQAYDAALKIHNVKGVKLSLGLFWSFPWEFPALDINSRKYLGKHFDLGGESDRMDRFPSAERYLELREILKSRLKSNDGPARDFPTLALEARKESPPTFRG